MNIPPEYSQVLKTLKELKDKAVLNVPPQGTELPSHCKPCEGGTPAMPKEKVDRLLAQYRGWQLVDDKKIVKEFKSKDFVEAKYFLDLVSVIAEEQGHHPSMTIIYNKVKITLTTHAAGGLTDNDFIMAKLIDEVGGEA